MKFIHGSNQLIFESYEKFGSGWLLRSPQAYDWRADSMLRIEQVTSFTRRERTIDFNKLTETDYIALVDWVINEVNWGEHQFIFEDNDDSLWPVRISVKSFDFRETDPCMRRGSMTLTTQGPQISGPISSPMTLSEFINVNPCVYPSGITRENRHAEVVTAGGVSNVLSWGRNSITLLNLTFMDVPADHLDALSVWVDTVINWYKTKFSLSLPFWSGTVRWWMPSYDARRRSRQGSKINIILLVT